MFRQNLVLSQNQCSDKILYYLGTNVQTKSFFLKRFFVPRTWSGCYNQILDFFLCKSLVLSGFLYWSTRGCNLAAHSSIHASFILRRGLTRFQLPKRFLGLRIIECRNSSNILEWGLGVIQTGNITLIASNHL